MFRPPLPFLSAHPLRDSILTAACALLFIYFSYRIEDGVSKTSLTAAAILGGIAIVVLALGIRTHVRRGQRGPD